MNDNDVVVNNNEEEVVNLKEEKEEIGANSEEYEEEEESSSFQTRRWIVFFRWGFSRCWIRILILNLFLFEVVNLRNEFGLQRNNSENIFFRSSSFVVDYC